MNNSQEDDYDLGQDYSERVIISKTVEQLLTSAYIALYEQPPSKNRALELATMVYLLNKDARSLELMRDISTDVVFSKIEKTRLDRKLEEPTIKEADESEGSGFQKTPVASSSKKPDQTSGEIDPMAKVLSSRSIFQMLSCKPWDNPKDIEDKYRALSKRIHPDRNSSHPDAISATARLNDEFRQLKTDPIGYTTRQQVVLLRGQAIAPEVEISDEEREKRRVYGSEIGWIKPDADGFIGNKKSYASSAYKQGGLKDWKDQNPESSSGQLMPSLVEENRGWLTTVDYSSETAHKFSSKGKLMSLSESGKTRTQSGITFYAKNK